MDKGLGGFGLLRADQVEVACDGIVRYRAIAAAVVPNGVVPLPGYGYLNDVRAALLTVFARRRLVFAVRTDVVHAADRNDN